MIAAVTIVIGGTLYGPPHRFRRQNQHQVNLAATRSFQHLLAGFSPHRP